VARVVLAVAMTNSQHVYKVHSPHNAVIRVYDSAGNVIETHEHEGEFKEP
jgi:hypothetical protein